MSLLDDKFEQYHEDNPHVYDLFKHFTFELIEHGAKHYSPQAVIERIRWHTTIQTEGDAFKINNNWSAYYSRMFMQDYPEHNTFFRKRQTVHHSL